MLDTLVRLYHKDVGFPAKIRWPAGIFPLKYTEHALAEAAADRFGDVSSRLPGAINLSRCQVIEAQVQGERLVRVLVCRMQLDGWRDLVLVVKTDRPVWVVKTVFVNRRSDQHRTLDHRKYHRPKEVD